MKVKPVTSKACPHLQSKIATKTFGATENVTIRLASGTKGGPDLLEKLDIDTHNANADATVVVSDITLAQLQQLEREQCVIKVSAAQLMNLSNLERAIIDADE